ncbi:MAG TPA: tRNA lysidine(34) synthetase TilS [Terriglobales bacterium]|nr:tRNA lysidine(34) synthetase TilS [Terriglobales bacterium]
MESLTQCVSRYIREQKLLRPGDRTAVAVSGGGDSVALFRLLLEVRDELGLVLSLVHINHRIRGAEADADQQFVAELASREGLTLHVLAADTPAYAAKHRLSLEAAARAIRYDYFRQLLNDGLLDKIATAHSLDDQAETVLLRLTRGTGTTGLAGIYPQWPIALNQRVTDLGCAAAQSPAELPAIVRPLLTIRRPELQDYLRTLAQPWREDATNLDPRYTRNRVRHRVLPLLDGELNPRVREVLAEAAEIARGEEEYLASEVSRLLPSLWTPAAEDGEGSLSISILCRQPLALQRRLVRAASASLGLTLDFEHVEQVLRLAQAPPGGEKQLILPRRWLVTRRRGSLYFVRASVPQLTVSKGFAYTLPLPGEVAVAETGTVFRASLDPVPPEEAGQAFDPAILDSALVVRNWRPGDRFWPRHTRAPKKVKELLQESKIPAAQRATWPVITCTASSQEQVIWLRGFPPPQQFLASLTFGRRLLIEEFALQKTEHRAE